MSKFLSALQQKPVIAAVREREQIAAAVASGVSCVFLLGGSILDLAETVAAFHARGKYVFVHLDLCEGLGKDSAAVAWCAQNIRPDGLISTKSPILRAAADHGMLTIQRLFVMDSSSIANGMRLIKGSPPDMVELLPGLVPKAIAALHEALKKPVIAGGMVTEEDEVSRALSADAIAVSTSAPALWGMF